jgi:hypothetical protein
LGVALKQAKVEAVGGKGTGEQAKRAFRSEAAAEMIRAGWGKDCLGKQGPDAGRK